MVKQFILIGVCLVFFTMQSQIQKKPEWGVSIQVLEETVSMFDIKLYNRKNPDVALEIRNYTIEDDFFVVSVWERATRKSKKYKINLRCLSEVELSCEGTCSFTLFFDSAVILDIDYKKNQLIISNCEVRRSQDDCNRITWSQEDDFVKKARQAFKQISYLNRKANN